MSKNKFMKKVLQKHRLKMCSAALCSKIQYVYQKSVMITFFIDFNRKIFRSFYIVLNTMILRILYIFLHI
jgi:hypothetical protein